MNKNKSSPFSESASLYKPLYRRGSVKLVIMVIVVLAIAGLIGDKSSEVKKVVDESSQETSVNKATPSNNKPKANDPNACTVKSLKKKSVQGIEVYSPDGKKYVLNKEDEKGIGQVYLGITGRSDPRCITCNQVAGGPRPDRYKTQAGWDPSGKWIIFGVERDEYSKPPILGENRDYIEGQIRSGLFINIWATDSEAKKWHQITDFIDPKWGETLPNGVTGPSFSPNGKKAIWSQIVDGNILAYWPFGRWELILMDFDDSDGVPKFVNKKNITPSGMHWNEPGNFAPDNETFIFSGSTEKDAQGMDQYSYNIRTKVLKNLTNTPTVWDEHGRLSPDGKKIVFMSAYPYRDDPNSSKILTIKTDFMMMDADGTNLKQLTYFRTPGYPEYSNGIAASPEWSSDGKSLHLRQLFFPDYVDWELEFQGYCGNQ